MSDVKNKTIKYQIIFGIISLVMAVRCCGKTLATSLTTALAFSYDYGFSDKSLMGTLFKIICSVFTNDVYTYRSAFIFSAVVMFVGFIVYVVMGVNLIGRVSEDKREVIFILLLFFTIFAMSIYTGEDYIGSAESVMLTVMLINVACIIRGSNIVALILCPIVGMVLSSDYIFAYTGVVIVLLVYRLLQGQEKNKYKAALIVNIVSTLSLYVFFSLSHTAEYEDTIREHARSLSDEEEVKEGLLDFYFYGQAGGFDSLPDLYVCLLRVIVPIILLAPFIAFVVLLLKKVYKRNTDKRLRTLYKVMPFGCLLCAPLYFYSNNYGTWMFCMIAYTVISILGLILMGEENIYKSLHEIIAVIKLKYKWLVLLLIYAVLFTPIDSVKVCRFVNNFIP